jgi:hypothetical protein
LIPLILAGGPFVHEYVREQREKVDSNEDVIIWLNLASDRMTVPELSEQRDRAR